MRGQKPLKDISLWRVSENTRCSDSDRVAVEAPLEIYQGDEPLVMMMRTPNGEVSDRELITGWLWSESGPFPLDTFSVCARAPNEDGVITGYEINSPRNFRELLKERALFASSSCGLCGVVNGEDIFSAQRVLDDDSLFDSKILESLTAKLRDSQRIFAETGGLHAAAIFHSTGEIQYLREDVGRHNAVDKVLGATLCSGVQVADSKILCVSGRISFEIVYKAHSLEIPVIVAVSAPTSLAIDFAERSRLTLCGFARDGSYNIYSHPHRVQ